MYDTVSIYLLTRSARNHTSLKSPGTDDDGNRMNNERRESFNERCHAAVKRKRSICVMRISAPALHFCPEAACMQSFHVQLITGTKRLGSFKVFFCPMVSLQFCSKT